MTEKSKQIFADKAKLREKLGIYLQTPEKVEIYAQAAEKMFAKTGGSSIGFTATWSWWAFFGGGFFFLYRKIYLLAVICLVLSPILSLIIGVVSALFAKYAVIKDFEKKLDLDSDMTLATGVNKWVIYVLIALVVIAILAEIVGGSGDESKSPKIAYKKEQSLTSSVIAISVISQDDDTIIKGVTVSGRNGKCEKQTLETKMLVLAFGDASLIAHKDTESCVKATLAFLEKFSLEQAKNTDIETLCSKELKIEDIIENQTIFDGQKLPYNEKKNIYYIKDNCLPKNGVWYVELDTNFGTYEYELSENKR